MAGNPERIQLTSFPPNTSAWKWGEPHLGWLTGDPFLNVAYGRLLLPPAPECLIKLHKREALIELRVDQV